jgi:hypothetical protein
VTLPGNEASPFEDGEEQLRSAREEVEREAAREQEQSYLKLLLALRAQPDPGRQVPLIASIARWVSSERVLHAISSVPAWFDDWELKEALFGNPATEEPVRSRIATGLAIFELMRELDRPGLSDEDRDEIKDEVREQIALLEDRDRDLVKARLKSRAGKKREGRPTAVLPAVEAPPSEAPEPAPLPVPPETPAPPPPSPEEPAEPVGLDPVLQALLQDLAAATAAPPAPAPEAPPVAAPPPVPSGAPVLFGLDAEEWDGGVIEGSAPPPAAPPEKVVVSPPAMAPELPAPPPIPAPVPPPLPIAPPAVAPPPAPVSGPSLPSPASAAEPLPEAPKGPVSAPPSGRAILGSEERAQLAALPVEQKVALAAVTNRVEQLAVLLVEKESRLVEALLDNPHLSEALLVSNIPVFGARQIELLLKRKRWAHKGAVRTAILYNPNTHPTDAIGIVDTVAEPKALLEVMRSPRVLSPQVKQRAKDRLVSRWWAMAVEERTQLIRSTGGTIFGDLWEQIFRDEVTLGELVRDRSLEDPVVLQLARSAMTPRSILGSISMNSGWTNNYAILLELVKNPKTPREASARLIPRLRPSDRKALRSDPSIPPALRAKLV